MIWMKVTNRDDFGYKYTLPDYDWIGGDTLLSAPGSRNIEENKIRGRRLGRGFAAWAEENDGYCVTLLYRDNYLNDGSIPNRSIAASVKPSGSPFRSYCGPMTAYRMVPRETIEDITLGDFRHLIDHLLVYGKETTHWPGLDPSPPPPPPPFALAPPPAPAPAAAPTATPTPKTAEKPSPPPPSQDRTIRGGKIFCNGERKLHGRNQFARFDFTPSKRASLGKGHVSPISKRLGMPLILWQDPDARYTTGPIGSWDCTFATFLMLNIDPASQDWAWASAYWQTQVGSVLVLREDGKDLDLEHLAMMAYFCQHTMQDRLESAMENGPAPNSWQKLKTLEYITWANMEKEYKGKLRFSYESEPDFDLD